MEKIRDDGSNSRGVESSRIYAAENKNVFTITSDKDTPKE
jgi:hypothetical protein